MWPFFLMTSTLLLLPPRMVHSLGDVRKERRRLIVFGVGLDRDRDVGV